MAYNDTVTVDRQVWKAKALLRTVCASASVLPLRSCVVSEDII